MIEDFEMDQLAGLVDMKQHTGVAEIHSSVGDFWQFLQGPLWGDMKRELSVWYEQIGRVYDSLNPSDETFGSDFSRAQGRREAIEYVLMLPEMMIEALEVGKEEEDDGTGRDETTEH